MILFHSQIFIFKLLVLFLSTLPWICNHLTCFHLLSSSTSMTSRRYTGISNRTPCILQELNLPQWDIWSLLWNMFLHQSKHLRTHRMVRGKWTWDSNPLFIYIFDNLFFMGICITSHVFKNMTWNSIQLDY